LLIAWLSRATAMQGVQWHTTCACRSVTDNFDGPSQLAEGRSFAHGQMVLATGWLVERILS